MFLGLPDPHPDPLDRVTDPRIRIQIRTKMSQIHNTDRNHKDLFQKAVKKLHTFLATVVANPRTEVSARAARAIFYLFCKLNRLQRYITSSEIYCISHGFTDSEGRNISTVYRVAAINPEFFCSIF
jgi:hypothetical protein